ncbi:alpha/beta fold hydrolase [Sphingomonas panacisoli]|uniref:Alpha/beta fold hydrolase n=1 Tax=Sphingomonas panacisoli TaxID=1813879 RepID=A0A5B8LES6_9SPHN|nr:alpha/beta fold hydrolase [Sphingomonas panacisoli]QDZ06212.1 alpha/beta fold hydrolase [Sphingomonas panacisoli]
MTGKPRKLGTVGSAFPSSSFDDVGTAYGLTPRQTALLAALIEYGGVREAADGLGISYTSARNGVVALKDKFGVSTVPMLIAMVLEFKAGAHEPVRHDLFSLTDRQFAIAHDVGTLRSREEIAERLAISPSVVDAELKEINLVLGTQSAGQIARVVASAGLGVPGVETIAAMERHTEHTMPAGILHVSGRTIGYSDYGPADGKPVVVLHSAITSRAPPTRLVGELRARGYRPITIDRPGYGDTDAGPKRSDPFVQAAHDLKALCDELGFATIDVVARGPGMATMRLHQLHSRLIRRAVLVNPTPAYAFTSGATGPLGAVKRAYARRPWAIGALLAVIAKRQTPASFYSGALRAFRDSPPDEALARNDPRFAADYIRAVRGFQQGRIAGYVAEQVAWVSGYDVTAMPGMTDWRIVQGGSSMLRSPEDALDYWRVKLPDTPIRWVAEAGQMLAYSHPHLVVDALD